MDLFTQHASRLQQPVLDDEIAVAQRVGVHVAAARLTGRRLGWKRRRRAWSPMLRSTADSRRTRLPTVADPRTPIAPPAAIDTRARA